ncbi:complex I NDUFA9 subunit family protein [Marinihelvus fidelis]|uniref:complex I NDUFA9 subunit family protein n=1 Tax=Marinihelvus fidelis TaxID=2613842 RepID=UPI00177DB959|nr:complex I NDUFA9 subunit family protein [Marinihelvus fidelis]
MRIVLVGASGFLGQNLVRSLAREGHECIVLTRDAARRKACRLVPNTHLVAADVNDAAALEARFEGSDAVVSMAGILNESLFGDSDFQRVHVDLVGSICKAAGAAGVRRILHVSAINAGEGESQYLASKGRAEALLLNSGLDVSIYRPSVIFGPGDTFFNRFAGLLRYAPVLPLACPEARMQPVFVGDVAAAMCRTLASHGTLGPVMELGGPRIYTLRELVRWTAKMMGRKRWVPGLPDSLSRSQALAMNWVPGRPFTLDNYQSLQLDNVAEPNVLPELGIEPTPFQSVAPGYIGLTSRQQRLDQLRRRGRPGR